MDDNRSYQECETEFLDIQDKLHVLYDSLYVLTEGSREYEFVVSEISRLEKKAESVF